MNSSPDLCIAIRMDNPSVRYRSVAYLNSFGREILLAGAAGWISILVFAAPDRRPPTKVVGAAGFPKTLADPPTTPAGVRLITWPNLSGIEAFEVELECEPGFGTPDEVIGSIARDNLVAAAKLEDGTNPKFRGAVRLC